MHLPNKNINAFAKKCSYTLKGSFLFLLHLKRKRKRKKNNPFSDRRITLLMRIILVCQHLEAHTALNMVHWKVKVGNSAKCVKFTPLLPRLSAFHFCCVQLIKKNKNILCTVFWTSILPYPNLKLHAKYNVHKKNHVSKQSVLISIIMQLLTHLKSGLH